MKPKKILIIVILIAFGVGLYGAGRLVVNLHQPWPAFQRSMMPAGTARQMNIA